MKKQKIINLIYSLLCLITVLLIVFIQPNLPKRGDFETFTRYLDEQIPSLMQKYHIQGASVALVHDSQLEYIKGFGYSDAEKKVPVNGGTLFQVASNSKPVAAWGVMKLVEEGLIDLDAPVSNYFSRWQLPHSQYDHDLVTIRRLLSHSSGIANVGGYGGVELLDELQTIEESLTSPNDADPKGVRVIYQPGSKYQYSGGAYSLLQLVVEEVSGLPFEDYMKTEILDPIGMTDSSYAATPPNVANVSGVFNSNGEKQPTRFFSAKAAAGLYSSAHDMAMYVTAMMLTDKDSQALEVLHPETLQEMYQPQPGLSQLFPYGLGYMLQPLSAVKTIEVSHTGSNNPGWRSLIATLPEKGEGLVLLTNSPGGSQLREYLESRWLYWASGQFSKSTYLNKLIPSLLIMVPIWIIGLLVIHFVSKMRKRSSDKRI